MLRRICIGVFAAVAAAPAWAGLYDNIYRGFELLTTPSGSVTSAGDGTLVNGARLGRLRIEHNRAGRGYELQLDRTFGPDSGGRPEVLDLGPYELELNGTTTATMSYTRGGFVKRRGFYTGNLDFAANNLQYALRAKSGFQDVELVGRLNATGASEVNMLGFYTVSLNVSNTDSELRLDGSLVEDEIDTDYDIGPINVRGNIFVDALSGILQGAGVDTTALDELFPKSPINNITDALIAQFDKQTQTAGLSISDVSVSTSTALADDVIAGTISEQATAAAAQPQVVPEPSTVTLLVLGGATLLLSRRRG